MGGHFPDFRILEGKFALRCPSLEASSASGQKQMPKGDKHFFLV
jgi:hypothetical protein